MGFRFHRSRSILPGVRVNLSKSGPSVSIGPKGARVNLGLKGVRTTVGIPGTGLSHVTHTSLKSAQSGGAKLTKRQIDQLADAALDGKTRQEKSALVAKMLSVTPLPQLKENKARFEAVFKAHSEPLSEEEQADYQDMLRLYDEAIAAKRPGVFVTIMKAILALVILLVCLAIIAVGCVFFYILVTSK